MMTDEPRKIDTEKEHLTRCNKWIIQFHNNYEEIWPADEYSVFIDRKFKEMLRMYPFKSDSVDYYLLEKATRAISNVPGLVCEIGLREGGGMKFIIDGLVATHKQWNVISIDPFGAIPYKGSDTEELESTQYTNNMKNSTLEKMYRFVNDYPQMNFMFFPLEDTEFFKRYHDGVPIYQDTTKALFNTYSLVHFDGPHDTESVLIETEFFLQRSQIGTVFVYDDIEQFYDHAKVEEHIYRNGFDCIEKTRFKGMYRRMK